MSCCTPTLLHFRFILQLDTTVFRLTEGPLSLNCFAFAEGFYQNFSRVAMGIIMYPNYVNLFYDSAEDQLSSRFTGSTSEISGRYIDDWISVTSPFCEQLNTFLSFVQYFHPTLEFFRTISETSTDFFDISFINSPTHTATKISHPPAIHTWISLSPTRYPSVYAGSTVITMTMKHNKNSSTLSFMNIHSSFTHFHYLPLMKMT